MKKTKLILLCGESASGKDTLLQDLMNLDSSLVKKISHTSRPKRDYEVDGVDYHFTEVPKFIMDIENFMELSVFNGWYYGTHYNSLKEGAINIGVFNPEGIASVLEDGNLNCLVVYIKVPEKIRLIRALQREEEPDIEEILRRRKTDMHDFEDIYSMANVIFEQDDNRETYEENVKKLSELIKDWGLAV